MAQAATVPAGALSSDLGRCEEVAADTGCVVGFVVAFIRGEGDIGNAHAAGVALTLGLDVLP